MIIFLDEDSAYLSWVIHHRQGFVLDGKRRPRIGHLSIHRATCPEIKTKASPHGHFTTGAKLKACSTDRMELEAWGEEKAGAAPACCSMCRPAEALAQVEGDPAHLSKLARDILDYVLDAAIIHFDRDMPVYHLTVADIAACFGKTTGQISAAIHRLIDDHFLIVEGKVSPSAPLPAKRIVLPTAAALRTLEAFRDASDASLAGELAKLQSE